MTAQEELDFRVLEAFVKADFKQPVHFQELSKILVPIIGSGDWAILEDMHKRGLVNKDESVQNTYVITQAGRNLYISFKRKIKQENADIALKYGSVIVSILSLILSLGLGLSQCREQGIQGKLIEDIRDIRSQNDVLKDSISQLRYRQPVQPVPTDTTHPPKPK